jgi:heme oxygenase
MRAGVRDHLRFATADIHQALHGAEPFARIAQGRMDRAGYGALLVRLHRYHCAMAMLCAAGAQALGAPQLAAAHRARVAALQDDLAFLATAPADVTEEAADDPAFAIGCLYTVQGSTLGGKVIYRQLDNLLSDADGRRFFAGTAQDGARWRELCGRLEQQDCPLARIEAGARHAFARFGALLAD